VLVGEDPVGVEPVPQGEEVGEAGVGVGELGRAQGVELPQWGRPPWSRMIRSIPVKYATCSASRWVWKAR
jgi:hypothetical protein